MLQGARNDGGAALRCAGTHLFVHERDDVVGQADGNLNRLLRVTAGRDRKVWFSLSTRDGWHYAGSNRSLWQAVVEALAGVELRLANPTRPEEEDTSDEFPGRQPGRQWSESTTLKSGDTKIYSASAPAFSASATWLRVTPATRPRVRSADRQP